MKWDSLALDLGQIVRELVHGCFLLTPVEAGAPVIHHLGEVLVGDAVVPVVAGRRLREPGAGQTVLEIVEVRLRHGHGEGTDACGGVLRLGHDLT
jgi:hypothetical protein